MIEVVELCKSHGRVVAADRVSFTAPDNQITGFVGPNGAGKSTVLRSIAQLITPDSGRIFIDGHDVRGHDMSMHLGAYLSPDDLPGRTTARSALRYVCKVRGMPYRAADEALEVVGLASEGGGRIRSFSMGMKQRLGLAVALLPRTSTLVLDEPLNGLDPDGIRWIREHLRQRAEQGVAVLLSSHVMSELSQTADRIVMLDRGKIVAEGTLAAFVSEARPVQVLVEVTDAESARRALGAHGLNVSEAQGGLIVSGVGPAEVARMLVGSGVDILRLQPASRSLEETYFGRLAQDGADV